MEAFFKGEAQPPVFRVSSDSVIERKNKKDA